MEIERTERFRGMYRALPDQIKAKVKKQLCLLLQNLRHPSLRARKMEGYRDIWEARVNRKHRFSFEIKGDVYALRRVGGHEEVLRNP